MVTAERLQAYLAGKLSDATDLRVDNLRQLTEGASYATYSFTVSGHASGMAFCHEWVLRMEPLVGPVPPYDVGREFLALSALAGSNVPVARVHWLEGDRNAFGQPFYLMDKVAGEVPVPFKSARRSALADPEERRRMAEDFVRVLAALHTFDWQKGGLAALGIPRDETAHARAELERWTGLLRKADVLPQPVLWEAWRFLQGNIPPSRYTCVVHGDFRLGNFIWGDGRIAAFLDWETVSIGDPLADLGFTCAPMFFDPLFGGIWRREEVLTRYSELTGHHVDTESVRWWQAMAYFKLGTIFLLAVKSAVDGTGRDLRRAMAEDKHARLLNELAECLGF